MFSHKTPSIFTKLCTLALVLLLLAASPAVAGECYEETPLPNSLEITPPDSNLPADTARFVGIWSNGKWDDKLCHTLAVLSLDADGSAEAIYSYGTYAGWNIRKAEYFKSQGTIADGKLTLETFRNGAKAVYWFSGDDLKGSYTNSNGGTSWVTLTDVSP